MFELHREGDAEGAEDKKGTVFVGVRRTQNMADVVTVEEIFHLLGQLIFRSVDMINYWMRQ